jgi:hypothetical protein
MTRISRTLALFAFAAASLLPAGGAHAQYYGAAAQPAPLYPYAVPANQPYAVEVAPGTYEIRRPKASRDYPYASGAARRTDAPKAKRPVTRNDPVIVDELRQRHNKRGTIKREVVNTKRIVHEKPVVIETTRIVDDPPKVIERRRYVDDTPAPRRKRATVEQQRASKVERAREPNVVDAPKRDDGKKRVIEADAEVTIFGPDRMSIRLFRKGKGGSAKASAE